MHIVIYSLGIVYEKMIVIVKRILIIFERLGNAVTIGVPETLAFCFVFDIVTVLNETDLKIKYIDGEIINEFNNYNFKLFKLVSYLYFI